LIHLKLSISNQWSSVSVVNRNWWVMTTFTWLTRICLYIPDITYYLHRHIKYLYIYIPIFNNVDCWVKKSIKTKTLNYLAEYIFIFYNKYTARNRLSTRMHNNNIYIIMIIVVGRIVVYFICYITYPRVHCCC